MIEDPVVQEVRAAREALLQRFDYDIHALLRDAQKRQSPDAQAFISFDKTETKESKTPDRAK